MHGSYTATGLPRSNGRWRVVIGGLVTSSLLTLLVLPAVYSLLGGGSSPILRRR